MTSSTPFLRAGLLSLLAPLATLAQAAPANERTIPNTLGEVWPLEHVSFDFPSETLREPLTATLNGVTRPAQIEAVKVDGREMSRVWTVVSIPSSDAQGNPVKRDAPEFLAPKITFAPGTVPAPATALTLREEGEFYVIENGNYSARIRSYKTPLPAPVTIEKLPHWLGGIRVKGSDVWDARAGFSGNAMIREAKTEVVASGPVHIDIKITYTGDETTPTEMVEAIPLTSGKQSFRYKPNEIPRENVPRYQRRYEALLRFVLEDPWIDVAERAHFVRDPAIPTWGFNLYTIEFGGPKGLPLDTAMWVRWFEWDVFGGNVDIGFVPTEQRPAQKGRPFAMLRPIWNQGGGGAQDFYLTSGGATPKWDNDTKSYVDPDGLYRPEAPAVGIHAAFPSKWVGPFAQTIVTQVANGDSGQLRFPLVPADVPGLHYGQRAYGLCAGPRSLFDDTGRMNGMVRRHTDWTLNALINRYVLTWPRDPAKAGPNLLAQRSQIGKLRDDFTKNADTPATRLIREEWGAILAARAKIEPLKEEIKKGEDAANALKEEPARKAAQDALAPQRDELRTHEGKLKSQDAAVLQLIIEGTGKSDQAPGSGLFRERRYQDDFLNPTSRAVRSISNLRLIDLFAAGQPLGSADLAALGYISTDPDYWMGWRNGWMPGNPNFHTDKYAGALYIGGAMRDHPHSADWIEFARLNYLADLDLAFVAPDGVGVECPGYSGYALGLMLPMAQAFDNLGLGNVLAENQLMRGTGEWHRKLLTPVNPRSGRRHEAPIGDTHRWDSGLNGGFGLIARAFRESDPAYAAEMMSVWRYLEKAGAKVEGGDGGDTLRQLVSMDYSLPEVPLEKMDWSSQTFFGFGAVLRSNFGTPGETFLSYKAGQVRGHYHNDENSFHYYANGQPIALDYNCSYTPRGDHAALHNSMTFGRTENITNNTANRQVLAMEQLMSSAAVGAFASTANGDLVVSERKGGTLVLSPVEPDDAEFARDYPARKVDPIVHRRLLLMVKHPEKGPFSDYLVVRDETRSTEPQQVNLHLTSRDLKIDGDLVKGRGQFGQDMSIFLAEGTDAKITESEWHYSDPWMSGAPEYTLRAGESQADWDARMLALAKSKGVKTLPLPDFKPRYVDARKDESKPWLDLIRETKGKALIQPINWDGPWTYGEYQQWLRIETAPGTPVLWVLYPHARGTAAPAFERLPGGVRITVGDRSEDVFLDSTAGARIVRGGETGVVLAPSALPPLGEIKDEPLAAAGR